MLSTIDGNCRHLRHINFLCLHKQIQRTGMDKEWVFTLPIFNELAQDMISTKIKFQNINIMYEIWTLSIAKIGT